MFRNCEIRNSNNKKRLGGIVMSEKKDKIKNDAEGNMINPVSNQKEAELDSKHEIMDDDYFDTLNDLFFF
jgi:hypothetical protein